MLDLPERTMEAHVFGAGGIFGELEFGKQALLDPEDRIGMDIGVVRIEDMGRQRLETMRLDDVTQMDRGWRPSASSNFPTGPSSGIG